MIKKKRVAWLIRGNLPRLQMPHGAFADDLAKTPNSWPKHHGTNALFFQNFSEHRENIKSHIRNDNIDKVGESCSLSSPFILKAMVGAE